MNIFNTNYRETVCDFIMENLNELESAPNFYSARIKVNFK